MTFKGCLFVCHGPKPSAVYAMTVAEFSQYQVVGVQSLSALDDFLLGSLHGAIILFDWDTIDCPYATLVELRKHYYVWPIIVVGSNIGHHITLDLLREQVNDIVETPLESDRLHTAVETLIMEFPNRSLLNMLFYITRTHQGLIHMEYRIRELEQYIKRTPAHSSTNPARTAEWDAALASLTLPQYRLLIVDDRPALIHSFKRIMNGKYDILTAHNAESALAIARQESDIDMIILDIEMPGRKGNEIIQELRDQLPNAAILIQTAYHQSDIAIDSFQKGALDYINKSESPASILEKIESVITMKLQWDANKDLPLRIRHAFLMEFLRNAIISKQEILWRDIQLFFPEKQYANLDKQVEPKDLKYFLMT